MIYFEHLTVGTRWLVGSSRVPKEEAIRFASQWEPQPYHVDEAAAHDSLYAGLTLCSLHLFAICTRLFFDQKDRIAVMAMLGKDKIRFPRAARPDDVLTYYRECVAKRSSRTRADRGIVTLLDTLSDPAAQAVLTQRVTLMVAREIA